MAGIGFTPSRPVAAEDVRDLQPLAGARRRATPPVRAYLSQRREPVERARHRRAIALMATRV